jgi:uncharacterized protein YjbJ (UPF0337 family)
VNLFAASVTNAPSTIIANAPYGAQKQKNMNSKPEYAKTSTTDKIEGNSKIVSGKIKEETGKAVRNPNLEGKGNAEATEGRVQKKVGEIKKVFGK